MHVQPTPHLFLALFTAKIYQLLTLLTAGQFTAHDVLRAFMPPPAQFAACKQALICGPNMRHTRVQSRNRVPVTWIESGEIAMPGVQEPFVCDATKIGNVL